MRYISQFILSLGCTIMFLYSGEAQQKVRCNNTTFKTNLEVVEAQISKETLSLILYEIDKSDLKYQTDNCSDCLDGKSLILDVDFKSGFKFPIEETDSVYLRFSNLQENLAGYKFRSSELNELNDSRNKAEEATLKHNAEVIKKRSLEISKQMQDGTISPEDAQEQLMALMEPQFNALENSQLNKSLDNLDEYEEKRPIYSIQFYNNDTLTDVETYSGYLYIKQFNESRFVAEYKGDIIEQCVEKRAASSMAAEQKCKSKKSQYLPDAKVLSEGAGTIFIDVKIKDFLNNR